MKNITLLFPGQGSQFVGMGKNLDASLFQLANEALAYDLKSIMHEGPEETLKMTENTQPAILLHSIGCFYNVQQFLQAENIEVNAVLGHSVGEYAALVAASVLNLSDALKATHWRGKFMQAAVPVGVGAMYAILKVPEEMVVKACRESSLPGEEVMPANFNDPQQIVISGHEQACKRAISYLAENYLEAHRAIELKVSAPFHSSLMKPAALKLKEAFKKLNWQPNKLPYIANINASWIPVETSPEQIQDLLVEQAMGPVYWTQSILKLPPGQICLELGPGKVLTGLIKKIRSDITVINIDGENDLWKTTLLEKLQASK